MIYKIDGTYTWSFPVHDSTGALSDADALPTAEVFEDDGDASMDAPTVEKIGAKTGYYRVFTTLATGTYTVGNSYNVMVYMRVGGTLMAARVESFVVSSYDVDDIYSMVNQVKLQTDKMTFNGSDQIASEVKAMDDGIIVASKIGLGAITADKIDANALDGKGDWPTAANFGTPTALDGGSATLCGMVLKIADDNAGADYDATTDSLHEIAAGGGGGLTAVDVRIEMDANSTKLAKIDQTTLDNQALLVIS